MRGSLSSCGLRFFLLINATYVGLGRGLSDPLLPFCLRRDFVFFVILDLVLPGTMVSFCVAAAYAAVVSHDSPAAAAFDGALCLVSFLLSVWGW